MDENTLYNWWLDFFQASKDLDGQDWVPGLRSIADSYPDIRSMGVHFNSIFQQNPDLAENIIDDPTTTINAGESAIASLLEPDQKVGINLRVYDLPRVQVKKVSRLRSPDMSKYISIEGHVTKATSVRPKLIFGVFKCNSCGFKQEIVQDAFTFTEPLECAKDDGGCGKRTSSTSFKFIQKESLYIDSQKIEIQEPREGLKTGEQPQRIPIYLEDDLCGCVKPGDRIVSTGVLKAIMEKRGQAKMTVFKFFLNGHHDEQDQTRKDIEVTAEDIAMFDTLLGDNPLDLLVRSFAPSIKGMDVTKTAMVLQMVGGVTIHHKDGSVDRGDIMIMLIGDPGTAKSSLASASYHIMPRSQWVEKGTTEAGLTAAAVQDDFGEGRYTLEAGAMVLADGSIMVMDDIHTWKGEILDSMLGPMERQVVAVRKAGINADLPCRTSVIALGNPKGGRFLPGDKDKPLIEMIDTKKISDPWRDRMDFVTGLYDIGDEDKDREMVRHILKNDRDEIEPDLSLEMLRKYIWYVRNNFSPIIPAELDEYFTEGYIKRRFKEDWDFVGPRTQLYIRHIFSCKRFAKASAKVRRSNVVNEADIDLGWMLVMETLKRVTADEDGKINLNALTTHMGSSKESMTKGAYDILKEMEEEENGRPVDKEEWIIRCAEVRIEVDDKFIQTMMDNKMIFEPSTEMYKTLR